MTILKNIKGIRYLFIFATVLTIIAFWSIAIYAFFQPDDYSADSIFFCSDKDNVAVVKMHGRIDIADYDEERELTNVDPIVEKIDYLNRQKNIDIIILDIYSPGGIMSAGEAVMNALKRSSKKTVAVIRETGTSSSYLAATGADYIYATRFAQVGSIGVTMSYLGWSEKNIKEGIRFISLSSAEFKDMLHPDKPLTDEEREKVIEFLRQYHNIFIEMIAKNRNMPIENVKQLADGSIFTTEEAINNGLIDATGNLYDIIDELSASDMSPRVCFMD